MVRKEGAEPHQDSAIEALYLTIGLIVERRRKPIRNTEMPGNGSKELGGELTSVVRYQLAGGP